MYISICDTCSWFDSCYACFPIVHHPSKGLMVVGGWHLVMEYASDGHQKKRCIICLCFFVLFYIRGGLSMIEGTPEAKCVATVGCVNFS